METGICRVAHFLLLDPHVFRMRAVRGAVASRVDAGTREGRLLREVRKTLREPVGSNPTAVHKALIERAAWRELAIALSCNGARRIRSGQIERILAIPEGEACPKAKLTVCRDAVRNAMQSSAFENSRAS